MAFRFCNMTEWYTTRGLDQIGAFSLKSLSLSVMEHANLCMLHSFLALCSINKNNVHELHAQNVLVLKASGKNVLLLYN